MKTADYYIGRGFLHPEKLKVAEKYRGKSLVDTSDTTEHNGVAEIRLCPYMYWCYLNNEMGWGRMRDYERPIRQQWITDGILKDCSYPEFTAKGKKFVEYVLKWAYPQDYAQMVLGQ
mgnify:FL=1